MEDDNTNDNENREIIEVHPKGASEVVVSLLIVALFFMCMVGTYLGMHYHDSVACASNDATAKAQYDSSRATAEAMMQSQKRDSELRLKLIQTCVDKGFIPVFMSGNIDCKVMPK